MKMYKNKREQIEDVLYWVAVIGYAFFVYFKWDTVSDTERIFFSVTVPVFIAPGIAWYCIQLRKWMKQHG